MDRQREQNMTGTLEFFLLTERQKQAWLAITGNATFPPSREAMMETLTATWERLKEGPDRMRTVDLWEDAKALGLVTVTNDGKSLAKDSMYVRRPRTTSRVAANDDASPIREDK